MYDRIYLRAIYLLVARVLERRLTSMDDVSSGVLRDIQRLAEKQEPMTQVGKIAFVQALHEAGMSP